MSEFVSKETRCSAKTGSCILATGGAGFVGSHTVVDLLESGYDVIVMDNLSNASLESIKRVEEITGKKVQAYQVDLLDRKALNNIFEQHDISCVIHFAGKKAVGESCNNPLTYYRNNVGGTVTLLEREILHVADLRDQEATRKLKVMKENGVFNLIFSSSSTVYGVPEYVPLDEKHKTGGCSNPYGRSKFFIEEILKDLFKAEPHWNIISLRYFNPLGAHESGRIGEDPQGIPNNLLPYIAQVAVGRLKELKIFGNDWNTKDGTCLRDYTHVIDVAKGHVAALKLLDRSCGLKIYNLGIGSPSSVLDVVKAFEEVSGKKIPYKFVDRRPGDLEGYYADSTLAERELGWKATRNLSKMCEDMWRWQSNNPEGYLKKSA